jgi:hypothetical protein
MLSLPVTIGRSPSIAQFARNERRSRCIQPDDCGAPTRAELGLSPGRNPEVELPLPCGSRSNAERALTRFRSTRFCRFPTVDAIPTPAFGRRTAAQAKPAAALLDRKLRMGVYEHRTSVLPGRITGHVAQPVSHTAPMFGSREPNMSNSHPVPTQIDKFHTRNPSKGEPTQCPSSLCLIKKAA